MIDYLALALAQEENISSAEEDESLSVGVAEEFLGGFFGGDLFPTEKTPPGLHGPQTTQAERGLPRSENPPLPAPNRERDSAGLSPRLEMPRVGGNFRFSVSRDATRAVPYSAEAETGDGKPKNSGGDVWMNGGFRQGQFPTRRGKNLPLPALSQYVAGGLFSAQAWPRGGVIFDSGGSIASVKAAAPGSFATLGWKEQMAREEAVLPLLRQVRQAQRSSGFVQSQRRAFTVTLPEGGGGPALSAEDFDLACERDARRYGGGFGLY